jgi:hypothetical protein
MRVAFRCIVSLCVLMLVDISPAGATQPPPNPERLTIWESLGAVSMSYSPNSSLPWEQRVTGYMVKDKTGVTYRPGYFSSIYYPRSERNCWQIAPINQYGQGPWSNEVCYSPPVPSTRPQPGAQPTVSCSNSVVSIRLAYAYLSFDVIDDLFVSGGVGFEYSFKKDAVNLSIPNFDCSISRSFTAAYRNSSGMGPVTSLGAFAATSATSSVTPVEGGPFPSPPGDRVGALCFDGSVVARTGPRACSNRGGITAWVIPDGNGNWRTSRPSDCVGICYGVPSKVNGKPRNSYVSGYFRSDGTYVKPYTRSS